MADRLDDETRRIPASMLIDPPDFDVSDEPGLPGEFVDVASLLAEVVRLRATIEDAQAVLADWTGPVWGDDAYIRVRLRAALGPAGADRQEQP